MTMISSQFLESDEEGGKIDEVMGGDGAGGSVAAQATKSPMSRLPM